MANCKPRRILLVNAEPCSAEEQAAKLTALGCQVQPFPNQDALLAALVESGDRVIFLDAASLGDDGPALVERVNRQASNARVVVSLRFGACAAVFLATTIAWALGVLNRPLPLYAVGCMVLAYNLLFKLSQVNRPAAQQNVERNMLLQILVDLVALGMLLYFADLPRNPFLSFFVFHMIIAGMYLRGRMPYIVAASATLLVGSLMLLEYLEFIPRFPLEFPPDPAVYLLTVFAALASTLWIAVYFSTAIRRYVDRAHAELRQKEKLLGIGQLVAGIAHQIANPLDGAQNCLRRIGEHVKDDPHLAEYVQMMVAALDRIERTAKRVQSFALPRGIALQSTDVNAFAAMPRGGTLTLRTRALGDRDDDQMNSVAIEVADTGAGIPRVHLERIFEPFFTTRADSGGTGLGLGLCRMLISEMGGRIEVRSVVHQGTVFTVVLNPVETVAVHTP